MSCLIKGVARENQEIYFLAMVDVLTHYGYKKMTAKVN